MEANTGNSSSPASEAEKWIDEHGDSLFRYALLHVHDRAVAEDLVQETFLAAFKSFTNFAGRSSVRSWLVGILKHKIIDYLRRAYRESDYHAEEEALPEGADVFDHQGHWQPKKGAAPGEWPADAAVAFEKKEFWKALETCLSRLPARTAQAFMLREMEDLSSEEVCKVLSVTSTNLWAMLHRARMMLRHCLEVNWFGKPAPGS
jgi:RNA polymerase sigma-70 factor (ECF subfamily)